jgi:diguanylate cyclase (GGDEF)-like protein/PAS domain S-box-containing protein
MENRPGAVAPGKSTLAEARPVAALFVACLAIVAWYLIGLPENNPGTAVVDGLFVVLPGLAALLSWQTARRLGAAGRHWLYIALGSISWVVGQVTWIVYAAFGHSSPPFPSLADAGYLAFYPLCCVGLVLGIRRGRAGNLLSMEIVLDSLLVFLAAAILSYKLLLLPFLDVPAPAGFALVVSLLWEAAIFALLFLNVGALVWAGRYFGRVALMLLLTGFIAFTIANIIYGQFAIEGTYAEGHLLDLGWHVGYVAIGMAAIVARREARDNARAIDSMGRGYAAEVRSTALIASVLTICGLAVVTALQPGSDPVLAICVGLFGITVAARLHYAARQANRLQERTRERDRLVTEAASASELARTNQALAAAEHRFRALVEQQPAVVYTAEIDPLRTPRYVSPRQTQLTGHSPEDWLARPMLWLEIMEPADRPRVLAEIEMTNTTGEPFCVEYRQHRGDDVIWVRDDAVLVRDEHGNPLFWQGIKTDVTERKRVEASLEHERDLLHALMDNVPDLVYFKDLDGRFMRLNQPTAYNSGLTDPAQAMGKSDADLFPEVGEAWLAEELRLLQTGEPIVNRLVEHKPVRGERRWLMNNKVPIRDRAGAIIGLVGIGRDVTDRLMLEEQLAHQAFHDPLTKLPNRLRFLQALETELASDEMPAVIFLDLDGFKVVNDSLGHGAGDDLLVKVAGRLRSSLRPGDLLARFGGDEFAVLVGAEVDAARVTERLLAALQSPFELEGRETYIGASAGIAPATCPSRAAEGVLRDADIALYEAKRRGRGRWVRFDVELGSRAHDRLHLEAELRNGLQNGELELHFQPIISLADNRIHGFEALVRWRHPARGLLAPDEFIEVAEETGLILPLGEWVLAEACRQAAAWRDVRPNVPTSVSVNVSPRQFRGNSLRHALWRALGETGLSPDLLTLEVTEAALVEDETTAAEFLQAIKGIGVRAALDDFGTGYSSLGRIHALPIDTLKIDRSFISGLGHVTHATAIVQAVATRGHELGLSVTAEGIETGDQARLARDLGCDFAQGYFVARPIPAPDATALLHRDHAESITWLAPGA